MSFSPNSKGTHPTGLKRELRSFPRDLYARLIFLRLALVCSFLVATSLICSQTNSLNPKFAKFELKYEFLNKMGPFDNEWEFLA